MEDYVILENDIKCEIEDIIGEYIYIKEPNAETLIIKKLKKENDKYFLVSLDSEEEFEKAMKLFFGAE